MLLIPILISKGDYISKKDYGLKYIVNFEMTEKKEKWLENAWCRYKFIDNSIKFFGVVWCEVELFFI